MKVTVLDGHYRKSEGSEYWFSDEKNVAEGTVRLIDGTLHYAVSPLPPLFYFYCPSKPRIHWYPVILKVPA